MRFSNLFQTRFLALTLTAFFALTFAFSKASVAQEETKPKTGLPEKAAAAVVPEGDSESADSEDESDDAAIAERTASLIQGLKEDGLRDLGEFKVQGDSQNPITFHIGIMAKAQAIIAQNKFDIRDDNFDLADFTKELAALFQDSAQYLQKLVPDCGITEFYFVLYDSGSRRKNTATSTKRNSSVMLADIRRWHKMYRGRVPYAAHRISIHELTHIANYHLDAKENKYHRELTGIVFELLNYYRTAGKEAKTETYLRSSTLPLNKDPIEVLSPNYADSAALRYVGAFLFAKVLDKTYAVEGDPNVTLEKFGRAYLSSKETGDAGFDAACLQAEIKDKSGKPLTLQTIRTDLYAALLPEKNAAQ